MRDARDVEIGGIKFTIQCHPFVEGLPIAYELNRSLRAHVLNSQKHTVQAIELLPDEIRLKLQDELIPADERQRLWLQHLMPKLNRGDLISAAADFLANLDPDRMAALTVKLFKYTFVGTERLSDESVMFRILSGRYDVVIPLMVEVIRHNDFLGLAGEELLNLG